MDSTDSFRKIIEDQKKTIEAYTNKLRDVVEAYKGLLVEKKALEETLNILNAGKNAASSTENTTDDKITKDNISELSEDELRSRLSVVLTSMSNLVAEKTHMEDGFKSKQKQLFDDKKKVESKCEELEEQVKQLTRQLKSLEIKNSELSQAKKDFQRSVKNLKQTTDKDKSKCSDSELLFLQVKNYEKENRTLKSELEGKQIVYETLDKKYSESRKELARLQEDFKNLQIEHEMAISAEKQKSKHAEEHAKKLTAIQEQRVNDLETKLATLSETIGTYDRQRLLDQLEIQKLKEHIAFIDSEKSVVNDDKSEKSGSDDYDCLKEKFLDISKKLNLAAQKSNREEDFKNLFSVSSNSEETHSPCEKKYAKLQSEFESYKNEVKNCTQENSGEVVRLQNHIQSLQEKVKTLSDKNEDSLNDYKLEIEHLKASLKNEKKNFQQMMNKTKADHKQKIWQLEEQLQKQRERSKALLEEKCQEIQSLQGTFRMFLPGYRRKSEDDESQPSVESNLLMKSEVDGPHIVHYANELARKDVEISSLRKSKHQIEMNLRELQKEAASDLEKYTEEKTSLLNEIARLERFQSTAGTKMEYLKNVVYNFLDCDDPEWRIHLCKAIAAVVKFNEAESERLIAKVKLKKKR